MEHMACEFLAYTKDEKGHLLLWCERDIKKCDGCRDQGFKQAPINSLHV
jgi:hypothetical protein